MEKLIERATQTAPAQTIRIEQAPIKIAGQNDGEPPVQPIYLSGLLTVGTLFGVVHIGVLGHLMNRTQIPKIDLPLNDYSSYVIRAGKDGYTIEYKGNDPKVMTTTKDIRKSNGLFGIEVVNRRLLLMNNILWMVLVTRVEVHWES